LFHRIGTDEKSSATTLNSFYSPRVKTFEKKAFFPFYLSKLFNQRGEVEKNRLKMMTNYFPEFGGSTGGWLEAAETEEKYITMWTNSNKKTDPESNIFEMPTGGAAIMKQGPNLVYFARKEQCLALGKQLRSSFKIQDVRIFRLLPNGEIQFLHPKDGVFPEKVNEGRTAIGKREFSIGKNPNPASLKFTGNASFEA
jgi:photosystem I subunit 2